MAKSKLEFGSVKEVRSYFNLPLRLLSINNQFSLPTNHLLKFVSCPYFEKKIFLLRVALTIFTVIGLSSYAHTLYVHGESNIFTMFVSHLMTSMLLGSVFIHKYLRHKTYNKIRNDDDFRRKIISNIEEILVDIENQSVIIKTNVLKNLFEQIKVDLKSNCPDLYKNAAKLLIEGSDEYESEFKDLKYSMCVDLLRASNNQPEPLKLPEAISESEMSSLIGSS